LALERLQPQVGASIRSFRPFWLLEWEMNVTSAGSSPRDELFISYAGEDGAFVTWLAGKLSAFGFRVWWDRSKLSGGDTFTFDIDDAILVSNPKHQDRNFYIWGSP
jgi:hypothetical protein